MRLYSCIDLTNIGETLGGIVLPEQLAHPAVCTARVELIVRVALHVVVVLQTFENVEHLGAGVVCTVGIAATGPRSTILPLRNPDGAAVVLQRVEVIGPLGGPVAVGAAEVAPLLHIVAMSEIVLNPGEAGGRRRTDAQAGGIELRRVLVGLPLVDGATTGTLATGVLLGMFGFVEKHHGRRARFVEVAVGRPIEMLLDGYILHVG